jgi:dTDP-4-amino-4,6-dideoxygalactose transaminase
MADNVMAPLEGVLKSGYIGQGPKVDEFEKVLGDYIGNPFVSTVNSGTSALHLAFHMMKNNFPSDRNVVLTTPLTCTATNFPIVANGFKIRWVDLDPKTCNVDLMDLRRKLTRDVAGIVVVHWGGYPVDLDELRDAQHSFNDCYSGPMPWIISDCAHALGATYKGKRIGSHGNLCVFSFQAIKHLTTGDGGALVCPWDHLWRRAKLLRWYGLDRNSSADFRCEQNIMEWGYKFHMNDIAATIGLANFLHIDEIIQKHQQNARYLREHLSSMSGLTLLESKEDRQSADWIFTILVERRDDFMRHMKSCGVGVSRVHDRNDKHQCLKEFKAILPNTDLVCDSMCCIPCGWWVTPEDREYIVECIKRGW